MRYLLRALSQCTTVHLSVARPWRGIDDPSDGFCVLVRTSRNPGSIYVLRSLSHWDTQKRSITVKVNAPRAWDSFASHLFVSETTERRWDSSGRRPNSPQKLARPGFGPAAEPPRNVKNSRRHAARIRAPHMQRAARRSGFGSWALAVQLSV